MDYSTNGRWEDCNCGERIMSCTHSTTSYLRGMTWCSDCGLTLGGEEE